MFEEPPRLERWDRVESRWNLGSVLVLLAGAALVVLGAVALARTGIDQTWFGPTKEVAGIRHTPLLAAIEAGVGLLLVIAGLAGAPGLAVFVCISAAMGAGVAALEPGRVADPGSHRAVVARGAGGRRRRPGRAVDGAVAAVRRAPLHERSREQGPAAAPAVDAEAGSRQLTVSRVVSATGAPASARTVT